MTTSRRDFLLRTLGALPLLTLARASAQEPAAAPPDSLGAERLRDPMLVGQPRDPLTALDNDPTVIAIERRLKCTCGCTLDIYTCRTTDFTCTFSPELHKEIAGMVRAGRTPEEIVATFVAREGEDMLMAPAASGFNAAGYVVPGLVMGTGALLLAAYLSRRREVTTAGAEAVAPMPDAATSPEPDDEQVARLRRALDDVES